MGTILYNCLQELRKQKFELVGYGADTEAYLHAHEKHSDISKEYHIEYADSFNAFIFAWEKHKNSEKEVIIAARKEHRKPGRPPLNTETAVRGNYTLKPSDHATLKRLADAQGITVSKLLEQWVKEHDHAQTS